MWIVYGVHWLHNKYTLPIQAILTRCSFSSSLPSPPHPPHHSCQCRRGGVYSRAWRGHARVRVGACRPYVRLQPKEQQGHEGRFTHAKHPSALETDPACTIILILSIYDDDLMKLTAQPLKLSLFIFQPYRYLYDTPWFLSDYSPLICISCVHMIKVCDAWHLMKTHARSAVYFSFLVLPGSNWRGVRAWEINELPIESTAPALTARLE